MSNIQNENRFSETQISESRVRIDYIDKRGNRWKIGVEGPPESVQQFVRAKPFYLEAESITMDEYEKWQAGTLEHRSHAQIFPSDSSREREIRDISLDFVLVALAVQPPYIVHATIDPKPPYRDSFQLIGDDKLVNVAYDATGGTIMVELDKDSGSVKGVPGVSGELRKSVDRSQAKFTVDVSTDSGDPTFSLDYDAVVPK